MKTIGLATFYDDNFGTCLQAFGLQKTISTLGYNVQIIRYSRCNANFAEPSLLKKLRKYSLITILKYLKNYKGIQLRKQAFADFRKKYLTFNNSTSFYRDSDLSELKGKYDAFVCGSDMMWSSQFKDDWFYFLLGFEDKTNTIAYSPSFGKNSLTQDEIRIISPLIRNIGHLSCREAGGVNMIKSNFGLDALHTVDPTLLLSRDEWNEIINNDSPLIDGDYILTYSFLGTTKKGRKKIFNQFKEGEKGKLVILSGAEKQFKKFEYKEYAGPIEFVRLYRDCKFVITDTYHGLLFALIFRKPFVVLDKAPFGVTADRLISTLEYLGLENRYIGYDTKIDESFLSLDYSKVESILNKQKELSIDYLKTALENAGK